MRVRLLSGSYLCFLAALNAAQTPVSHVTDVFSPGWMLEDTNADGVVDFVRGKIVVPAHPSAVENTAAANFAARLGFSTTGLTPPLVISAAQKEDENPRIWIGQDAVPQGLAAEAKALWARLQVDEGGVFALQGNLIVLGHDEAGLLAAADAFSARAPYQWKVSGEQISAVIGHVSHAEVVGVTYAKGKAGIARVFLRSESPISITVLKTALNSPLLSAVHEIVATGQGADIVAISAKSLPAIPPSAPAASDGGASSESEATPQPLDLATLYTSKGLFKGTAKMPLPSSSDAQLYVPAGMTGIAMANLAARMGLETTGLSLPIAQPVTAVLLKDVHTKAVVPENSDLGREVLKKLLAQENAASHAANPLAPGEGDLRIVDHAFGKQAAVLVRGDDTGSSAVLAALSDRFPNLWETGKQFASLEEPRFDLHRFFSLRSPAGQAAAALYHLDRWAAEINRDANGVARDVKAEAYVEVADPRLEGFIRDQLKSRLHIEQLAVKTGSLHAGTQCCSENPALHYEEPGFSFRQASPTFQEDLTIPWEGTRLLNLVRDALHDLKPNQTVSLVARVSEGPQVRQQLKKQLLELLGSRGIDSQHANIVVLCAYKQGYSWLLDEVAPKLERKSVARLKIEFAKDVDSSGVRVMYSPARWVQELYPVDEMLAAKLNMPLKNIELSQFEPAPDLPTYRVRAFDAGGSEIFSSDFTVSTAMRSYNGAIPRYEQVQVDTGWVKLSAGSNVILDQRVKTDIEEFWDHYQEETLPKIFQFVMSQAKGDLRPEFAPAFDTLRIDFHLSEPDYSIGLDKERISSLEALQEDTFYATENFIDMMGNLEAGKPFGHVGRIIPVVHASDDAKDGRVHIEFYGKPAANPLVRLSWTDAKDHHHEKERNLPVLAGSMQPRLIGARLKEGEQAFQELTWLLPADYADDKYDEWIKLEPQDQVERSVFSVEQANGQIQWLRRLHDAGLYRDEIAYPHMERMGLEWELPVPLTLKSDTPAPRSFVAWNIQSPMTPRPMISRYAGQAERTPIVQWDEPISPDENTAILAKLGTYPGVNVYWMGRSYLGRDMWAADFLLPSPSQLRSWAKETTLKASIIYSGRQHANEVSSTSHIDKLGEQLATDPQTRALLKQVNVIIHPIDNPDGAELSIQLAKVTPDNLLHPGYHGSLAADVSTGQSDPDPVYPESRTRRLLLESWLPDGFLNPHGYPSHEWVQPFSEYTGWVQTREGANPGRAWWIPRGWFTSLTYIRDPEHPYSEKLTYELRDRIVEAERNVPGLLPLETRMNDRYERFGQRWQPKDMTQPIVDGIRIYMALKGMPAPRTGSENQRSGAATGGISPDITWDSGYTEAPDETAHGDYLKLMASAGLAFDRVHLNYLANGKLRIRRVQREAGDKVTWQIIRDRPNLPVSEASVGRKIE